MSFWSQVSNHEFWKWYQKLQKLSEEPLEEDERLVIVAKNTITGEKREFGGLRLKSPGKKRN